VVVGLVVGLLDDRRAQRRGLPRRGVVGAALRDSLGGGADGDRHGRRRLGLDVDDVGDDRGDVVGSAAFERQVDEPLDDHVGVGFAEEGVAQGLLAHDAGQAVAAEQVAVPGPGLAHRQVEVDVLPAVQGVGDQVPLRVVVGLLGRDAALVDEGLHERCGRASAAAGSPPQQVGTGVTDVHEAEAGPGAEQGGERRAHPLEVGVALGPCRAGAGWHW
jgi:hypothetical protein